MAAIMVEQQRYCRSAPAGTGTDDVIRVDGKVWVPAEARELVQRIVVVAHCGRQGHRGADVMLNDIAQRFSVNGLQAVVGRFVRACLLCKHVKGGQLIQQPWGPTTIATRRNQCLHVDYLSLGESYSATSYVLVLKEELTHYCELIATDAPTSLTAAETVLDWFKRFGLPEVWISDNGSHFKAELMDELASRPQPTQHFVPVYSPWINGTVERVNRDILQVLRVTLLELRLDTRNWLHLLPLVQANLNHSAVASLGDYEPPEFFTGLPVPSQLDSVVVPDGRNTRVLTLNLSKVHDQLEELRAHLHALHTEVTDRKERKRLANMARGKGTICNFERGDFVLWSRVDKRLQGDKLLVRWVGPFRISEALSHSFKVKHLLTSDEFEVHGSRLKHYSDADRDVTEELRQHIASQGIVMGVRAIEQHRFNQAAREWQLYVAWCGHQDSEITWEPFASIYADVPTLVRNYVESGAHSELEALLQ